MVFRLSSVHLRLDVKASNWPVVSADSTTLKGECSLFIKKLLV